MERMENALFDSGNRILGWLLTVGSVAFLKIDDFIHAVSDVGEVIIMILGICGGVFIAISYFWQARKNRADAKRSIKRNKDEGIN